MMWRNLVGGIALVAALLAPVAGATQSFDARLDAIHEDISNWQIPPAQQALEALAGEGRGDDPQVLFARARLAFFTGDYRGALAMVDQAMLGADERGKAEMMSFRELAQVTFNTSKDYKVFTSPTGRFELRVEPGKDEIVVPYAFETLEGAYERLSAVFGYTPPTPIVVEMYPTAATLAAVSPLTEEDIKNSGTIALCKYNRLMFTSPKALLQGYSWRDTMSHEFAHLVITQASGNTVPIWMHEGLAKYLERLWREGADPRMLPYSENILSKGIKEDKLITFAQMHPSMAKLPTQEATSLAFAEVYTVMEYLERKQGRAAFARLMQLMREGKGAERAMEEILGVPFATFQRQWNEYLKTRPSRAFDEEFVDVEKLTFVEDKPGSELLEIGKKEARDLIHLGELLQARERYAAAVVEYRKARALIGDRNPVLQTRLGRSLIVLKRHEEAVDVLAHSLDYYPSYHNTHALLGEALLRLGRLAEAEEHLLEAVGINPFDPTPHRLLAEVYEQTQRPDLAERARRFAQVASG
jgi:tetratricopeptide (TPR) repeat protein